MVFIQRLYYGELRITTKINGVLIGVEAIFMKFALKMFFGLLFGLFAKAGRGKP